MQKFSVVFLSLVFLTLLSILECMNSDIKIQNDISSHNLQIKFLPDENKIIAIDTLQIKYLSETNDIYFYLHDSLKVDKIIVGNQTVTWEILEKARYSNSKDFQFIRKLMNSDHVNLYKVHLPLSLFPEIMRIYYEGEFCELTAASVPANALQSNECCINSERINLHGSQFWYPSLPDSRVTYKLITLTPVDLEVATQGELVLTEQNEDSLLCIWEQKQPIEFITLTAAKKPVKS
ncbi:MAG TPA: hypothetical protein PLP19_07195 [bacterium]|nr:hypothetical protein [bacterium]HPN43257.1 hypothetical protein [bacterium]